jgi:hypothetical protein
MRFRIQAFADFRFRQNKTAKIFNPPAPVKKFLNTDSLYMVFFPVADPGCLCRIRIFSPRNPDPWYKKAPDPGQRI